MPGHGAGAGWPLVLWGPVADVATCGPTGRVPGGYATVPVEKSSPLAKASTMRWATSSWCCTGGDFMK